MVITIDTKKYPLAKTDSHFNKDIYIIFKKVAFMYNFFFNNFYLPKYGSVVAPETYHVTLTAGKSSYSFFP